MFAVCLLHLRPCSSLATFPPSVSVFSSSLSICRLSSLLFVQGQWLLGGISHQTHAVMLEAGGLRSWLAGPDLRRWTLSSPLLLHSPSSPPHLSCLSLPPRLTRILPSHLLFFWHLFCHFFPSLFFSAMSSLPCAIPFYFHLPFFSSPPAFLHPSFSSPLLHSFPPSFTIFNILCYDVFVS